MWPLWGIYVQDQNTELGGKLRTFAYRRVPVGGRCRRPRPLSGGLWVGELVG